MNQYRVSQKFFNTYFSTCFAFLIALGAAGRILLCCYVAEYALELSRSFPSPRAKSEATQGGRSPTLFQS